MPVKTVSTQKTIIPEGYVPSSVCDLKQWQQYLHEEIVRTQIGTTVVLLEAQKVLATRQYRVARENKKQQSRQPMPPDQGDRIIMALLFAAAFLLALIGTFIETP